MLLNYDKDMHVVELPRQSTSMSVLEATVHV